MTRKQLFSCLTGVILAGSCSLSAHASALSWDPFVIRNANAVPHDAPTITENADGQGVTTTIDEAGQKTGYGTTGVDGDTIGSLVSLSYTRTDAGTSSPYLNIWVTDGTNYALIAPVAGGLHGGGYSTNNINGLSLQTLGFNIYDNSTGANYDWLFTGATRDAGPGSLLKSNGDIVTLADISNLLINVPSTYPVDTGAPETGDGFNLVFGDTQGNFVTPIPYAIDNVTLTTVVPTPAAALGAIPLFGLLLLKKRTVA
ncbi:MAG TPA: hypothetical protein VFE58_01195 [Tepidisphaeraceae bacterium]|jgi:hypothetical protein|nr:hypothetical protein [Tepidisphaeraceae bacterium]